MKLTMSPQAGLPGVSETIASVAGDVLTVDGTAYDLTAIPEGGEAMPEGVHPFVGAIRREGGEIIASIVWIYGEGAAVNQPTDPAHYVVTVADGAVPSPIIMEGAE